MSKLGKEGQNGYFEIFFKLEKDKRGIVSSSSKCKKGEKCRRRCSGVADFILEREHLTSL